MIVPLEVEGVVLLSRRETGKGLDMDTDTKLPGDAVEWTVLVLLLLDSGL